MARKKASKSVEEVAGSKTRVRRRRQPTSKKSALLESEPEESGSQKLLVVSSEESGDRRHGHGKQKIPSRIKSKKKLPAKRELKKRSDGSDGRSTLAADVFKETQRSMASGSSWTGEQQLEPSPGVCSSPGSSGASQITARSSTLNELMQQRWLSLSSEDQSINNSPSSSNPLQPSNSSDILDLDKQPLVDRKLPPLLNSVRTTRLPNVNADPAGKSSPKCTSDGSTAKRHECPSCDKTMSSRSDLVKHIRTHTGERPYTCSYCPASFTQLGSLRAHETRHTGIKPFICQVCKKAFSIKERLKVHMRVHTGVKPFVCKLCDKSFARGSQLIQHKRVHTGEKPYACSYCDMKFGFATNLKLHEKKHTGTKDYECPRCYKGFVRQDALRRHIQSYHENERPLHCPICDKSFKGHLGTHLRVHTQEKPFQCDACPAAFAQNSQLTVHQRTHTGDKPYPCQVCPQKFAHSTALKVHLRQHTGEKPYRCPVCGSFFNQLPHMKKHLRSIHQQPDPYMCGVCKLFFKTKSDRERHVEQDHGDLRVGQEMDPARAEMLEPETMPEVITRGGIPVSKLRAYLAILMKKISNQTRLVHFGFGSRLIDEVLKDSLETAGRTPFREGGNSVEMLRANVQLLLDWTIPSDYMEQYRRERKTIEEILEELAS